MDKTVGRPGEKALIALKDQSKAIQVFKKPTVPLKKRKQKVILNEDIYLKELGKIIQRDFFPDLEKLKAQNEYLEAIASNDITKLRQIFSRYSSKRRPTFDETPTFDTPVASEVSSSARSTRSSKTTATQKTIGDNHSLDSFFDKYTSEDNESFEEIIEAAEEKLKQKFAILYCEEDKSAELLKKSLTLPAIEKQFESTERPNKLDTWTYKNKNYIMYIPDGVDFTQEEKIEMAKRKQEISHNNTRLSINPFNDSKNKEVISELAKNQTKGNSEKVGLDGKTVELEAPEIRGFGFVKSPSPCPSLIDSSPLMTWGEVDGTPFRLDASDTPFRSSSLGGHSFRIAETSKRETLALQLAENVSEKHRAKKTKAIEAAKRNMYASPHVRSSLNRLASMSPAARRLSTTKFGLSRDSWATPSPRTRISTPSKNVPVQPQTQSHEATYSESLTDNLLDIPSNNKRSKAADYF